MPEFVRLREIAVRGHGTLRDVVAAIEAGHIGLAVVIDEHGRLVATLTDGDIRRSMLASFDLQSSIEALLQWRAEAGVGDPISAPVGTSRRELLALMQRRTIRHVPLLDEERRLVDLATLQGLALRETLAPRALIMAGGYGKRLGQLTSTKPKPMLQVGSMPILERIVRQLHFFDITKIFISLHYLGEQIVRHFGDGSAFDVTIQYIFEEEPLGTCGAISLLQPEDRTLLVMNGDLLTSLDFRALGEFHHDAGAAFTMAVRNHDYQVPFGVVQCDGLEVLRVVEKPTVRHLVNAGIYMLEPHACAMVPKGSRCDMPELVSILLSDRKRVAAFPIREEWFDIGRPEDYERAQGHPLTAMQALGRFAPETSNDDQSRVTSA